ncbi:hypothetical protein Ae201684P_018206 [Aphanomyces euteiches]|nr:hypothetical protein Ae201684P_018206 [Aphanomyces euteiches]
MAQVVERISARELAVILKDPAKRNEIRIVDVRDDDFRGGHIRGAINLPEDNFQDDDDVDNIVEEFKNVPTVVFHCMMSAWTILCQTIPVSCGCCPRRRGNQATSSYPHWWLQPIWTRKNSRLILFY